MKKLMMILFGAVLVVAPFANVSDARGARGGRARGGGISGRTSGAGKKGSSKEKQRMRELTRCEERDSLIDGKLRRRSR